MKPVTHMNYASNMGLTNQPCSTCNTDTLHKGGRCVHCASRPTSRQSKDWSMDDVISKQAALQKARARCVKASARA